MNKSFFYSAVVALVIGSAVAPTAVFAQDSAAAVQPAATIADLQSAMSATTPDLTGIMAMVSSLLAQDPNNASAIQALAQNASPAVQEAINAALSATGAIGGATGATAPAARAAGGANNGGGGGGASGTADNVTAAIQASQARIIALIAQLTNAENTNANTIAQLNAVLARLQALEDKVSPS